MAMKVPVRRGGKVVDFALVDEADYPKVAGASWVLNSKGYPSATIGGRTVFMHRYLVDAQKGEYVDHINGNILDNRRSNLRKCTQSQNLAASKPRGSSKYKGVRKHSKVEKWYAGIKVDGKFIYLGLFDKEEEAARAYDRKAIELRGEFARTNFPREDYL